MIDQKSLRGIAPVLLMVFKDDGSIDLDGLTFQVEDCLAAGVSAIALALGSELPKLTDDERKTVIAHVAAVLRARVPFIVNTGAESVAATFAKVDEARSLGADAAMVMAPLFLPAGPGSVAGFFRAVLSGVRLPIIIQDMGHAPLAPATMSELAALPNSIALKVESHPTTERVHLASQAVPDGFPVFGGHGGSHFIEELDRGAIGTMPFASQPRTWVAIFRSYTAGARAEARATFASYISPITHTAYQAGDLFYHIHKRLLVRRGLIARASVRSPTIEPDHLTEREIEAALDIADIRPGAPA
jgi:dihydrodipicolinate synthase/N-acetylneuraminate lyase